MTCVDILPRCSKDPVCMHIYIIIIDSYLVIRRTIFLRKFATTDFVDQIVFIF